LNGKKNVRQKTAREAALQKRTTSLLVAAQLAEGDKAVVFAVVGKG
jgi:hypothetical protein